MADERRYREEEAEEIFALAVRSDPTSPSALSGGSGLTLSELQEIGQEAGIDPRRIVEAAQALDTRGRLLPQRRFLGTPVSVGRVVQLSRPLTDREWDLVVADLRDTFAATGRVDDQGGAREWANGNLRVILEPSESGHQLRLSTLNGRLLSLDRMGVVALTAALVLLTILVPEMLSASGLTIRAIINLLPTLILGGAGAGILVWNRFSLPRWADERAAQMQHIAGRARALVEEPRSHEPGT